METKRVVAVISLFIFSLIIPLTAFAAAPAETSLERKINDFGLGNVGDDVKLKTPDDAVEFMKNRQKSLGARGLGQFDYKVGKVKKDGLNNTHIKLQQYYNGVPIYGNQVLLHTDSEDCLYALNGRAEDTLSLDTNPRISKSQAIDSTRNLIDISSVKSSGEKSERSKYKVDEKYYLAGEPEKYATSKLDSTEIKKLKDINLAPRENAELVIYNFDGNAYLCYEVTVGSMTPKPSLWKVFVDAKTGQIINKYDNLKDFTRDSGYGYGFYDDKKSLKLLKENGTYHLVQKTNSSTSLDDNVIFTIDYEALLAGYNPFYPDSDGIYQDGFQFVGVDAHYYVDQVYNYYKSKFGRNSWDGKGASIDIFTFGPEVDNASWDPVNKAFLFGYGDYYTAPYSSGLDVIAHEYTHAVTDSEVDFAYQYQPGALSESYSDVFAALIDPDWQLGEDVVTLNISGDAMRDMSYPERYGQPSHMSNYIYTSSDNGGVHINSGIPNKAFYNIASAIGREDAGKIYYQSLDYLTSNASFQDARDAVLLAARDLVAAKRVSSNAAAAVADGWAAVGVYGPYRLELDTTTISLAQDSSPNTVNASLINSNGTRQSLSPSEVTWRTSNANVAVVSKGVITPMGKGTAVITASYGAFSATVTVNVTPAISQLQLDKTAVSLIVGSSNISIKATAVYTDGTKQDVTKLASWISSEPAIASIVSPGIIKGNTKGNVSIIVSYGGKSIEIPGNVALTVKTLAFDKTTYDITVGDEISLAPIAFYADGTSENVAAYATWSSSNMKVATVSSDGVVRAVGKGKATITAKYNNKSATKTVSVTPEVEKIETDKPNVSLVIGGSKVSVKLIAYYVDKSKADVTKSASWNLASPVDQILSVSNGSLMGLTRGETILTVGYKNKTVEIPVIVTPKVSTLTADIKTLDLTAGKESGEIKLTAKYNDGSEEDVTGKTLWKSSKTTVATVAGGIVTPLTKGTASITGSFNGKTVTVKLTVTPVLDRIASDKENVTLVVGGSKVPVKITAYYVDGSKADVTKNATWKLASPEGQIASVSIGSLMGLSRGETILNVSYKNKMVNIPVIVTPKVSILTADTKALDQTAGKESGEIKLTAKYNDGSEENVTAKAVWKSSKTTVATVAGGVVTPLAKGTASITGSFNGKTVTVKVTVTPVLDRIAADKENVSLVVGGGKVPVKITAYYVDGSKADVTKNATWKLASPEGQIASVNNGSLMTVAARLP